MQKAFFIIVGMLFGGLVKAQDPRFSQYQASPLNINPAMTGYFDGDSRLSLNYRTQFYTAGSSFNTGTISYESILNHQLFEAKDQYAIGVIGLFDQSAGGGYKTVNAGVSGSYRKLLDDQGNRRLSLGSQIIVNSRTLNTSALTYASQFASYGFDLSRPNNENTPSTAKTYVDASVGLLYNDHTDEHRFYAGAAFYHLNRPDVSFQKDDKYKLPIRTVFHAGYRTFVGQFNNYLLLNSNVMLQGKASDIMLGGLYGIVLGNEDSKMGIDIGAWYRIKDALIPYIGLNIPKMQIGISYDNITSGLRQSSPRSGSFEVSFRYNGAKQENPYIKNIIGRGF